MSPATTIHRKSDQSLPSIDQCKLHLLLLASFAQLRNCVHQLDGLYGIRDGHGQDRGEARWTIFVAKATQRFEKWFFSLVPDVTDDSNHNRQQLLALETAVDVQEMDLLMAGTGTLEWENQVLPPLDVLMVFHSYMLNPRAFLQDCLRYSMLGVWKAGFPWQYVERHLSPQSLNFEPPQTCTDAYERVYQEQWHNPGHGTTATLTCPGCGHEVSTSLLEIYDLDEAGQEKGNLRLPIHATCSDCHQRLTQDSLVMARLRDDLRLLQGRQVPLPGTLLSAEGLLPGTHASQQNQSRQRPIQLNYILRSPGGQQLLDKISADLSLQTPRLTLADVHTGLVAITKEGNTLSNAVSATATSRLIARYHQNHSSLSLDLVGAVIRQSTFVTKMQSFDWLHSPAVNYTVQHAIERYAGFFKVMSNNPGKIAVPTFDVDLAWHTHQLSPTSYYDYSLRTCNNIYIDHDDKIGDSALTDSFQWTCEEYTRLTGSTYDKCLCWSCDILSEATETPRMQPKEKGLGSRLRLKIRVKRTPRYQPSAAEIDVIRLQASKFEIDYQKAASKHPITGQDQFSREDFFDTYTWHHPDLAPFPQELGI